MDEKFNTINQTAQSLASALKQDFAEVEAATRVHDINSFLFTPSNKSFSGIEGSLLILLFCEYSAFA